MTEEKLEQIKLKFIEDNLEIYKKNKDLISMYDEYIVKIVELFDLIRKKDSDLFYTMVFTILVEIGFFSAGRKFNPDEKKYCELYIKPGLNIICGAGVCRNISCFYEDIFSYFYNYPLKLCCLDLHGLVNEDTKRYGNHMINLSLYKDTIYGVDVLNHCVFKACDYDKLNALEFNYSLEYVPNGDLLVDLITTLKPKANFYDEVNKKYELLEKAAKKNILSVDEYGKIIEKANDFIVDRKIILQGFLVKNEELTYEIKKKMLSLK